MAKKCLSLVITTVALCASLAFGQSGRYDGRWWLSIDERNRTGYVVGFEVCYVHMVDRKVFHESARPYSTRLTGYLQANPNSVQESVDALLLEMASPRFAKPVHRPPMSNEDAVEAAAKWGANNNGDEWRGPSSWNLGYVEGFLDCYSKHTKSEYGTFSERPEWYVNAIANWYGTKPNDSDSIDLSGENEKIPDVLIRFLDKPEK